jgi:hypothetical protein
MTDEEKALLHEARDEYAAIFDARREQELNDLYNALDADTKLGCQRAMGLLVSMTPIFAPFKTPDEVIKVLNACAIQIELITILYRRQGGK